MKYQLSFLPNDAKNNWELKEVYRDTASEIYDFIVENKLVSYEISIKSIHGYSVMVKSEKQEIGCKITFDTFWKIPKIFLKLI